MTYIPEKESAENFEEQRELDGMKDKKTVTLKFKGIDYFNRPVFKDVASHAHYGSTHTLFEYNASSEKIIEYFRSNIGELEYFGNHFGCEPWGGISKNIILNIVKE